MTGKVFLIEWVKNAVKVAASDPAAGPFVSNQHWSPRFNMFRLGALVFHSDRFSLKQRVLDAGAWSVGGYGLGQVIRFGSNLLMARLLMPDVFGVMAIATMVMVALALFTDIGLRQKIVQSRRANDPAFINTAWVTQIFRSVIIWIVGLCMGLLVFLANQFGLVPRGSAYADPTLPYVIAALSFGSLITAFYSTKLHVAVRDLTLRRLTANEIIAQLAGLPCMILWALIDRSVWALVAGGITTAIVSVTLSHVWLPGIPNRWEWDRSAFFEIMQFGKWLFVSSILTFLMANGDRLLLGGLVDATLLGTYTIAFLICGAVEQGLTRLINSILFPALSEIARERPHGLKQAYYRAHAIIASVAYGCSGILMTSGQALVSMLYDQRYEQAGWMLAVLATTLMTLPFQIAAQTFMALGQPRPFTMAIGARAVALFVATPVGFYLFGLPGAVCGIALSYFLGVPVIVAHAVKRDLLDLRSELRVLPVIPIGLIAGTLLSWVIGLAHGVHPM